MRVCVRASPGNKNTDWLIGLLCQALLLCMHICTGGGKEACSCHKTNTHN